MWTIENEGWLAFLKGWQFFNCPYLIDRDKSEAWMDGWFEAEKCSLIEGYFDCEA